MKKAILYLLIAAMLMSMLPLTVTAYPADSVEIAAGAETVTVDGVSYTVIRDAAQFTSALAIAGNYILANDIDLGGLSADSVVRLTGTTVLDGNGYALKGYSLTGSGDVSTFLVNTGSNVTIRNLTLGSAEAPLSMTTSGSGKSIGAIFGYANCTALIENVTAYVNIKTAGCYTGGLMGNLKGKLTMIDCVCYGKLDNGTGTGARGGIIGQISAELEATLKNCINYTALNFGGYNVGGIAGRVVSGKPVLITGCTNYANIKTDKYAGGIVGQFQPKNVGVDYTIEHCNNYGNVVGGTQSGGLFGDIGFDTAVTGGELEIRGCYNYGNVSGEADMSGVVGRINSKYPVIFVDCANFGGVTGTAQAAGLCSSAALGGSQLTVSGFLNTGAIKSTGRAAGGVTGWLSGASTYSFSKCVNLGSINGNNAGNLFSATCGKETVTDCGAFSTDLVANKDTNGYVVAAPSATDPVYSNIYYIAVEGVNWNNSLCTEAVTLEGALTWLNANLADAFGGFILNNDGNGIVQAAPKLAGLQESLVNTEGKQSIRFVGVLKESLRYSDVGFELTIRDVDFGNQSCNTVYRTLLASENGEIAEITAEELGGKYIYALTVKNIPADGTVVMRVRPYAKALDGETLFYGAEYEITYRDGVYLKSEKIPMEKKK